MCVFGISASDAEQASFEEYAADGLTEGRCEALEMSETAPSDDAAKPVADPDAVGPAVLSAVSEIF